MTNLDAPARGDSGRWHWVLSLKVGVTLLLLWWVFRSTDLASLALALGRLDAVVVAGALALVLLQQVVLAWRWHRILHWMGARWPFTQALRWVFVGLFFNQALPTAVGGDAVRVWALHRQGLPPHIAFGSVAVERGSGLALLALMIALAVLIAPGGLGSREIEGALLGSAVLIVLLLLAAVFADKWLTRWLPTRMAEAGARFGIAMRAVFKTPRAACEIVAGGCIATWLGLWAAVWIGRGLGLEFEASVFFAFVGGAILLTLLPLSLGGWGVREAGMVTLFGQLGAPADSTVVLSMVWGILPLVVALPGGAYFWWVHRKDASTMASTGPDTRSTP